MKALYSLEVYTYSERPLSAIRKHREFIKELQSKKAKEAEDAEMVSKQMSEKKNKIRKIAEKQRTKVKEWKNDIEIIDKALGPETVQKKEASAKQEPLTAANLEKMNDKIEKANPKQEDKKLEMIPKSKDSKRGEKKKPIWALTEKQLENMEDKEADNLIQFAYELDYEKYMEDFEVRQALEAIKKRVSEINVSKEKKDEMIKEIHTDEQKIQDEKEKQNNDDKLERESAKSEHKSHQSKAKSVKSIAESARDEVLSEQKPDWNKSVKANEVNPTIEDKIASKIADQVMANAPVMD